MGSSIPAVSSERLEVTRIQKVKRVEGQVELTVVFTYEPWTDGGPWDQCHAIRSLLEGWARVQDDTYRERNAALVADIQSLLDVPL